MSRIGFYDVDINDKTILQEQINFSRKYWNDLINDYDKIGQEINDLKRKLVERKNVLRLANPGAKSYVTIFENDDEYNLLNYKIEAAELGKTILEENLNFVKSDIKILTNSMYNKF